MPKNRKAMAMDNRRTWTGKGFIGYKNQNPDFVKWIWNGTVYVTDLKRLRAQEQWEEKRKKETGL